MAVSGEAELSASIGKNCSEVYHCSYRGLLRVCGLALAAPIVDHS